MPQKDSLGNDAPKTWWGMNTSDFILERSAPSIYPKPIVNWQGTNSQVGEVAETKGLVTNVFLPKFIFWGEFHTILST